MSAFSRGLRNPFRNRVRSGVVVLLLSLVIGLLAVMIQSALLTQQQMATLQAEVRTLIEVREAGAFGTGGFGGDEPVGAKDFSVATLERVRAVPSARHITGIEEYVNQSQVDPTYPNAYAMIIGHRPGAAMRAIGEADYENARIVAGRALGPRDADRSVAVVGQLYARERLGLTDPEDDFALAGSRVELGDEGYEVVGIYTTGNDFGDNHVFVPIESFRRTFNPGGRLSKMWVTVDSVAHVATVAGDLEAIPEADVVTAAEQVSTAQMTLGNVAATSLYGSVLLFAIGGVLVFFVMVLTTRERVREIGTLKAMGASNREIVSQFLAEVLALVAMGAGGAVLVALVLGRMLEGTMGLAVRVDGGMFLLIGLGSLLFAAIGSLYPFIKGTRLSPIQAMKHH